VRFRSWRELDCKILSLTVNEVNMVNVSEVCDCIQHTSGPKCQKCYWWVKVVCVNTESCRCNKRGGYLHTFLKLTLSWDCLEPNSGLPAVGRRCLCTCSV
jgi:hypothetical protein